MTLLSPPDTAPLRPLGRSARLGKGAQAAPAPAPAPMIEPAFSPPAANPRPLPQGCLALTLRPGYRLALLSGSASDRRDLLAHWERLSPDDQRSRFFSICSPEFLASRAAKLDFEAPRILGVYNAVSELVACGEWALDPETPGEAECAFSCNASDRGQGLSKALGLACFMDAAQFGVSRARIETLRENHAARALAASLGARWVPDGPGFGVARAFVSSEGRPSPLAPSPKAPKP